MLLFALRPFPARRPIPLGSRITSGQNIYSVKLMTSLGILNRISLMVIKPNLKNMPLFDRPNNLVIVSFGPPM